jgi:hypothetical protein
MGDAVGRSSTRPDNRAASRLYPRLLGAAWDELDPAVQRVHTDDSLTHAEGLFQVSRAPGRLLGLILDLAGVPRASDRARVRLAVECRGPAEHWLRAFEGRPLTTVQTADADGRLVERAGVLEFRFRLAVKHGDLLFRQESLALCLGSWRLRLPHWLALQVAARESAVHLELAGPLDHAGQPDHAGPPDQTRVEVRVMLPGGGLLFSYRGTVRWTG